MTHEIGIVALLRCFEVKVKKKDLQRLAEVGRAEIFLILPIAPVSVRLG